MNQNNFGFNNNQNINDFNNPMLNQYYTQMSNPFFNQNYSGLINNNIPNNNMNLFNQNQFSNNMNFNPNQMNQLFFMNNMLQNLMMQNMIMNQMIMNANMNQNNNNVQNNLNNSVDLKGVKKDLIDSIIKFYQKNGKSYMNYGNPKQIEGLINHLTYSSSENLDINEPLSYIEGPTVTMNFIFRSGGNYYVSKNKLPKSISKFELYTIIMEKYFITNDFILVYKETILDRDDSNLETFSDNDNISIIKDVYYPDDSYYNLLSKKTGEKINIIFSSNSGIHFNMILPQSVKIGELVKAFYTKFGIDDKNYFLLSDGKKLSQDDNMSLYEECHSNFFPVTIASIHNIIGGKMIPYFGKTIIANIKFGESIVSFKIGLLNSTNHLIMEFLYRAGRSQDTTIVKKLIINEIEIKKEKSLKSLGIKKDFSCYIELKS